MDLKMHCDDLCYIVNTFSQISAARAPTCLMSLYVRRFSDGSFLFENKILVA